MKTLEMRKDPAKNAAFVECATGEVSVYRSCAYCAKCSGIRVGPRTYPVPLARAMDDLKRGKGSEETMMGAVVQFNTLVRDGTAIECGDDKNTGFLSLFRA